MVRAPCCDKVGLKKGPWTQDEDSILTSYIQEHGHGNWRALPKQAGLLRCGKSCRLRWTNYLRPDIKRGNFSKEEEDTILQLHQQLGNRWSTIAGKLPGRTDNEIKNVWHTHLKKKLQNYKPTGVSEGQSTEMSNSEVKTASIQPEHEKPECESNATQVKCPENSPVSPQCSSSELSSVTEVIDSSSSTIIKDEQVDISIFGIDESFWSEALSSKNSSLELDFLGELQIGFPLATGSSPSAQNVDVDANCSSIVGDGCMDFWYDVFMKAAELPDF